MRRHFVGDHVGASGAGVSSLRCPLRRAPRQIHREVMPLSRDAPHIRGNIVERDFYCDLAFMVIIHITFWETEVKLIINLRM